MVVEQQKSTTDQLQSEVHKWQTAASEVLPFGLCVMLPSLS